MRNVKKLLSIILIATMISISLVGCGSSDKDSPDVSNNDKQLNGTKTDNKEGESDSKGDADISNYLNTEGFPIVKEPITLKAMVSRTAVQPEYGDMLMWQKYEEMTGIKIEWENVPDESIAEKRNLALASGEYPDVFFRCKFSDNDMSKYGAQGVFIPINAYIDEYAPNLKKAIDSMEDVKKSLPEADGNIYGFPGLSDSPPIEINPKLFINRIWLNNLGLEMPKTTDEYYEVLREFKDNDPNGNGKGDEIPLTSVSLGNITNGLKGAWGLNNRGRSHGNVDVDEDTGELRFIPISDGFKGQLEYMNKLYTEGLMDEEIFTMDATQAIAKGDQDLVGSFFYTNTQIIGGVHEKDFEGLEVALKGPNGHQLWGKRGRTGAKGGFVITDKCEHPEAAVRWIDYFYSEEGTRMFYMGIEGETYEKTAEGAYEFLPEITENIPEGSSFDQVISHYVPYAGGNNPTMIMTEYFKGGETHPISLKAAENMDKFTAEEIWGKFSYTLEEVEEKSALESDINEYINQMIPQFVEGRVSFSEWDNYVKQIEDMGLGRYMEIYKAAHERYMSN